jgi:hypothetical protein
MEKSPDSLMIHISIYARDTETKTEWFPDGEVCHHITSNTTEYDRYSVIQALKELD